MKKVLLLNIIIWLLLITGCQTTNTKVLPDLKNLSREEIKEVLDKENIEYFFKFEKTIITNEGQLDKFVRYGNNLKAGDKLKNGKSITVYTTVLNLSKNYSPTLTLDAEWNGKSFLKDGIGEVTLDYVVDGDTAWFYDEIAKESFKLRFLGVDTPETKAGEDPWGMAASNYTKKRLESAKQIIIEGEGAIKDTYGRYLGFVWVDGTLLNLEIIEEAYSNSTLSKSKYSEIFLDALKDSIKTGRRFFGYEIDPDYDYEKKKFKR